MPTDLLKVIADRTKAYPYTPLSDSEAEELAGRFGEQAEDLQHIATLILFLKQRLVEVGAEPVEVVAESRTLLDRKDIAGGHENEIADILSPSKEEQEEARAVEALSAGPTFLSTTVRPCLLPVTPTGTELVGGYLWTVSYLDAERDQRSVTIGLTPGELEQLEATIDRAKEQLNTIRDLTSSARTE